MTLPKRMHIIWHEETSGPGAYASWAVCRGWKLTASRLFDEQPLPKDSGEAKALAEDIGLLVILGGPQSPDSTKEQFPYFDAPAERAFIKTCIDEGRIVVGSCLGAQMIGEALGALHENSPYREIGCFPVRLTEAGRRDPLTASLPDPLMAGEWHIHMPGLTEESTVLAESDGCPRQIVRYADKVIGLQCHLEFNQECLQPLLDSIPKELPADRDRYCWTKKQFMDYDYTEMNRVLWDLLDRLAAMP